MINNLKALLILISFFPLICCSFKQDFEVKVSVENLSEVVYDSIMIHTFPDRDTVLYSIKPKVKTSILFKYRNFTYPKREDVAVVISAYKGDYYYIITDGIIDSPFGLLQEKYNFFIWDNGFTVNKDIKPTGHNTTKHKISEIQD